MIINNQSWLSIEDLPNERWKEIDNYNGLYQISDYGRVKSLFKGKPIILKQTKSSEYLFVNLYDKNGNKKPVAIHRLVGIAFIPNPNNLPVVMHLDDNKHNNNYTNLMWGTYGDNILDAYNKGLNKRRCVIIATSKDGSDVKEYSSITEASQDLNVCVSAIANCLTGRSKSSANYYWKYK
jgi:hypothetical protein